MVANNNVHENLMPNAPRENVYSLNYFKVTDLPGIHGHLTGCTGTKNTCPKLVQVLPMLKIGSVFKFLIRT